MRLSNKRKGGGPASGLEHRGTWGSRAGRNRAGSEGDVPGGCVLVHTDTVAGTVQGIGRGLSSEGWVWLLEDVFGRYALSCQGCLPSSLGLLSTDVWRGLILDELPVVLDAMHLCVIARVTALLSMSCQDSIGWTTVYVGVLIISTVSADARKHWGVEAADLLARSAIGLTLTVHL